MIKNKDHHIIQCKDRLNSLIELYDSMVELYGEDSTTMIIDCKEVIRILKLYIEELEEMEERCGNFDL